MSNATFYGGTPIDKVDFESEYNKEIELLKSQISNLEQRKIDKGDKFNYRFWTIKLNRANKALEQGTVSLDGN